MRLVRLCAFFASVSLVACGGGSTPTVTTDKPPLYICQTFTPCHDGNVVGRWKLSRVCLDDDAVRETTACGDAKNSMSFVEITGYTATGTLEIDADGTATFDTDELAYEHSSHPAACSADPSAAASYCDAQRAAGENCTLTNGDCDCTWVNETSWPTPTSTYQPGDTTIFGMDFCVNGAGLTLRNEQIVAGGDYVFVPE